MHRWLLPALGALAGCGGDHGDEAATPAQLNRLSTPESSVAPQVLTRLEPLSGVEIAATGRERGCTFARGADILLVSAGSNAVAKVDGSLRFFVQTAPAGPTGGFFEDRDVSISIGSTSPDAPAARISVSNRRAETHEEAIGTWICDGADR